jgi:hypothetical protein
MIFSPVLNKTLHSNYTVLSSDIKRQIPYTKFNKKVDKSAEQTELMMKIMLIVAAVINLVAIDQALKSMLMMIRSL